MLFGVGTFSTMDTARQRWGGRYHRAMKHALFVVMVLVVMDNSTMNVEAVTHPGDIEALKEVGFPSHLFLQLANLIPFS